MSILDIFEKNETANSKPDRIYFMNPTYAVGGGDIFFLRLIEYIFKFTNRKVGIIDFSDGILTRTGKKMFPNEDIHYIPYESFNWKFKSNSCIVIPEDRIGDLKNTPQKNTKIICFYWNTDIAWNILFRMKTFLKLSKELNKNNACVFMDYGCYIYNCIAAKQRFAKNYVPLFFHSDNIANYKKITSKDELHAVWLGRISTSKTQTLINVIENYKNYKTDKKKFFHIIGNGNDENLIKDYCKKIKEIEFIFTGVLTGHELNVYMQKYTDVGFAMGTALLNFASLSLPVIAVHEPRGPFYSNKFLWLFNVHEYCLGSPLEESEDFKPMFTNISIFDEMLDDISIHNKYEEYGKKCFEYFKKNHNNIETVGKLLLKYVDNTSFTFKKLKKCIKYLPYVSSHGILQKKYGFFNIPILKSIKHFNKTCWYFMGVPFMKISSNHDRMTVKLLGIPIIRYNIYGRYDFASVTSEKLKQECKDKYSITSRIFD